jgi:hypothetical protein
MTAFRKTLFTAALLVMAMPAFAQTQPQTPPEQSSQAPGMMGGQGMMGHGMIGGAGYGNTMPPGAMMDQGMMGGPGAQHTEGRLAFLKTELKITDSQSPQWNAFADAMRANAKAMSEMHQSMMSQRHTESTLPERLAFAEKALTAHLDMLKKTEGPLDKLYEVLTPDQKKIADDIVVGPMGMPMGMM